jgi:amino acid transporter
MLADFADLLNMVSISTLFAFWIVALGLIWFRGYERGVTPRPKALLLAAHMAVIVAASIGRWLQGWGATLKACGRS